MPLKITNAKGGRPVVELYETIGAVFGGLSAEEFRRDISTIPSDRDIDLHINSDGGIFTESIAMYTTLRQRKGAVYVFVDGIAASGASIVAMAGKEIEMAMGSWMMIHEAQAIGEGKASDMRKAAERLDAINQQLIGIYSPRWKGDEDDLRSALFEELWMTEADTVEWGLADRVSDSMAIAARVDVAKFQYKAAPPRLVDGMFPRREAHVEAFNSLGEHLNPKEEFSECVQK